MGVPRLFSRGVRMPTGVLCASLHAFVSGYAVQAPPLPEAPPAPCPAAIHGAALDTDGDQIPYVQIRVLSRVSSVVLRTVTAEPNGTFTITSLPAVPCAVEASAKGFLTQTIASPGAEFTVRLVPADTADVTVNGNQEQIAEAQIKLEEQQMIAGFIPNFYVAYDFHAAPLNKRQKFELAYKTLINPYTNMINAGVAGLEQADDALPGYGQGGAGYGKRFAAQTADTAIGTMLAGALLPIVFRQDPRYFYLGRGTAVHRLLYALSTSVVARGDNGHWQPAYAALIGDFGAGAISNLYYPKSDRSSATVTIYNGLLSIGIDGFGNVVQEFVFKHFTPHAGQTP